MSESTDSQRAVRGLVGFYEDLSPDNLEQLSNWYATDAWFKDPFNEVTGIDAIGGIFKHMFATLHEPRFQVQESVAQGNRAFLIWTFTFRSAVSAPQRCIRGASHVVLNDDGKVAHHRDYWDTGEELYEKTALIGGLFRFMRRRLAAPQPGGPA